MKKAFLILALTLAGAAHADPVDNHGTIACFQNPEFSPYRGTKTAVVLRQIGHTVNYDLTVYRKPLVGGTYQAVRTTRVRAEQEDVMLSFRNPRTKTNFMIYLDELDQSWLTYPGYKLHVTCRFANRNGR